MLSTVVSSSLCDIFDTDNSDTGGAEDEDDTSSEEEAGTRLAKEEINEDPKATETSGLPTMPEYDATMPENTAKHNLNIVDLEVAEKPQQENI